MRRILSVLWFTHSSQGLKKEYFSEITAAKVTEKTVDGKEASPRKPALKKRKVGSDDPFASDDDNNTESQRRDSDGREETAKRENGNFGKNKGDATSVAEKPKAKKRKGSA